MEVDCASVFSQLSRRCAALADLVDSVRWTLDGLCGDAVDGTHRYFTALRGMQTGRHTVTDHGERGRNL